MTVLSAERSKARVCGRSLAGIAGSNSARGWMPVSLSVACCLWDGPIPRPEESYRLCCVTVCDLKI